jgi:hypothetical protein
MPPAVLVLLRRDNGDDLCGYISCSMPRDFSSDLSGHGYTPFVTYKSLCSMGLIRCIS